jgi:hypothetical protein
MVTPPILSDKHATSRSVFEPAALLREARRQKNIATAEVPEVCILDPDGDLVRNLRRTGKARRFEGWPCYHTELDTFELADREVGIVGRVVGASFGVLVAEELFASGCQLLISLTSAGQIVPVGSPPYFVIIDRALRDEGTSYHRPRSLPLPMRSWLRKQLAPQKDKSLTVSSGQAGLPMHRSVRHRKPSRRHGPEASLLSRWKPPHCIPLPVPEVPRYSAWRTSPTPWRKRARILKRVRPMARGMRWLCSAR